MEIEILNLLKMGKGNTWEFTGQIVDDKEKIPIFGSVSQGIKTDARLKKIILQKANKELEKYIKSKQKPKEKVLDEDMIFRSKL